LFTSTHLVGKRGVFRSSWCTPRSSISNASQSSSCM
jgi:hypothetical protein